MKWIYRFFVVLGIIFFIILLGLAYFIIADPLNLRPLFQSMYEMSSSSEASSDIRNQTSDVNTGIGNDTNGDATQSPSGISAGQAQALESVGINPEAVPTSFTPEQQRCFVGILGQARVDAIVAGATPTPSEFYQAKSCL